MSRTVNTERRPSCPSITVAVIGTSQKSDRRIAREIRNAVGRRATVTEVDVDDLASMGTNVRRSIYMNGPVPVFVISEAMLATAPRRAVLASGNPYLEAPDYRAYFIWTLRDPAEAIRRYPDLTPLADNMPKVRPHGDVIDDLRDDLRFHTKPTLGKLVRSFFGSLGSLLMVRLAWFLIMARLVCFVAQIATVLLAILLLFDTGDKWRPAFAVFSLINLGWIFGGIETLDVWPWFCGDADAESAASESSKTGARNLQRRRKEACRYVDRRRHTRRPCVCTPMAEVERRFRLYQLCMGRRPSEAHRRCAFGCADTRERAALPRPQRDH